MVTPQVAESVLEPVDSSITLGLGGQGNAVGWVVVGAPGSTTAVPDATYRRSGRTVVILTWGEPPPPMHPVVGTVTGQAPLGSVNVGDAGICLEHPAYQASVPEVPPGRYEVWFVSFAAEALRLDRDHTGDLAPGAAGDPDGTFSVVTIWLHLRPAGSAPPLAATRGGTPGAPGTRGAPGDAQLTAFLDEYGVVLTDPPVVDRLLAARASEITEQGGLLAAIGATDLGEELLDAGAFFPVWNLRPWTYRFAGPAERPMLCPFGQPVGAPVELAASEFATGIRVVPGPDLRGAVSVDWSPCPTLRLAGAGPAVRVQTFVVSGPEPLAEPYHAGIVATFWLEWITRRPAQANSNNYPLIGFNPLSMVPAEPVVQRALRTRPVRTRPVRAPLG